MKQKSFSSYTRIERISQEIYKKVAIILQCKIEDPRIGIITVQGIKVSNDLTYAKIFVTFLNIHDLDKVQASIKVLQNASGFIRKLLGRTTLLRVVPKLAFFYDYSVSESMRIHHLIDSTVKKQFSVLS